ncbi:HTH-type transcriptional regulator YodB [Mycobacterium basiliense]|uniref:HTH-type transcriptional regulator YodB n=1 Tax=Mycobacterium basiliense TaxID=2094119 RepID=A0A3S4DRM9_9MYCO|nr:helix-turn-helix domain-containing protein [Mycobacterium basiliense]VDM87468.1 HTH-type transcriptional regulator YodB [Mycobacterium basiliense]
MSARNYNQNCPIARGLDILGERWTLLILRELVGGARRYGDLRAELSGIATNLLAQRLAELQDFGLVERTELPPPIGRTVYTLSDVGWRRVLPILQAIAWFGLDRLDPIDADSVVSPLNGFLAGILLGFDPARASGLAATYRVEIDGRRFEFAVDHGRLGPAHAAPAATVTAGAADLVTARLGPSEATRKAALERIDFDGDHCAIDALRTAFSLCESSQLDGSAGGSP